MTRRTPVWLPAAATALLVGGVALRPVFNQETPTPLLSSENAPPARDEDAGGPGTSARRSERGPEEPEIDRDPLFERAGRNPGSAAHAERARSRAGRRAGLVRAQPSRPGDARVGRVQRSTRAGRNRRSEPDPRFHDVIRMSDDTRADDFPAIVTNPDDRDDVWMVYASYSGRRDELRLARRDAASGIWGPWNPVPGVTGDVWRPSLAFDAKGRLWIVWAQQEPFDAAFDLYARWFDGERWGPARAADQAPEGDFDQQVARAGDGTLHLVWQGFRGGQSDIFYSRFDGDSWSPEQRLSTSDANDWAPAVAVDSKGNAHVIWDTYDRGDYDVVGRVVRDGQAGRARHRRRRPTSSRRGRRSPSIRRTGSGWRTRSATRAGARTTAG